MASEVRIKIKVVLLVTKLINCTALSQKSSFRLTIAGGKVFNGLIQAIKISFFELLQLMSWVHLLYQVVVSRRVEPGVVEDSDKEAELDWVADDADVGKVDELLDVAEALSYLICRFVVQYERPMVEARLSEVED